MKNIPRISIEDPKELYEEYILQNKPIIISNFQDNWANSSVFTKVNLDEKVKQFFFTYSFSSLLFSSFLLIFLLFSTNICVFINLLFYFIPHSLALRLYVCRYQRQADLMDLKTAAFGDWILKKMFLFVHL